MSSLACFRQSIKRQRTSIICAHQTSPPVTQRKAFVTVWGVKAWLLNSPDLNQVYQRRQGRNYIRIRFTWRRAVTRRSRPGACKNSSLLDGLQSLPLFQFSPIRFSPSFLFPFTETHSPILPLNAKTWESAVTYNKLPCWPGKSLTAKRSASRPTWEKSVCESGCILADEDNELRTRKHVAADCRHDMRPSVQLPNVSCSGADSKLCLTMA